MQKLVERKYEEPGNSLQAVKPLTVQLTLSDRCGEKWKQKEQSDKKNPTDRGKGAGAIERID